ncbi:MAG: YdcF family protein [Parcubacteria group bacterium]|nr:YdcF family protein [Parcubacteria group bacterium]
MTYLIVISYTLLKDGSLGVVTKESMCRAIRLYSIFSATKRKTKIILSIAKFWYATEESLKRQFIADYGISINGDDVIVSDSVTNTVNEADEIKKIIRVATDTDTLIIFAQIDHSRRIKFIYRKLFPHAQIILNSIDEPFEKTAYQPLLRNRFVWRAINAVHLLLLKIFGLNSFIAKLEEPRL